MDSKTSSVLLPFSGEITVDTELNLSNGDFKQSIEKFYKERKLSTADQPKQAPAFPTPHVLAQFANMAYEDCQPEKPEPPPGWKFLTTAYNSGERNGYFGTAYWHPEHQQVVIAHRGTVINPKDIAATIKDVYTDVIGVVLNNYVQQISSASTFANKVVKVLQEMEQQNKVSFELFFTGHSLGGWLAQITTFTVEYLAVKELKKEEHKPLANSNLQDSPDVTHSYHPHTVVFDSLGCKDMLSQMADKLDVGLKGHSVDLQHLDITSYLSAPNLINTFNSHLGIVYRIFTDLSDMSRLEKRTLTYNFPTHRMDRILQAFDPETGQVRKNDKGELKIQEVVDWPIRGGLMYGAELKQFFKWAKHSNDYHPEVKDISYGKQPAGYNWLRYQTTAYNECTKSQSVFTQNEREFLEGYLWLRHVPAFFKPEDLFTDLSNVEATKGAEQKLKDFELSNGSVICPDASTLHALVSYVKWLVRNFPHINEKVKDQIRNKFFKIETERYAGTICESAIKCMPGNLGLREFLDGDQQICQLRMVDGDAWTGISRIYCLLQSTPCNHNYSSEGHYTILEIERLLTVKRMINLNTLLAEMETPHLLMIACGNNQTVNGELRDMFRELFSILKQKNSMKIILTAQSECDTAVLTQQIATETLGEGFIATVERLTWRDLTASSQKQMLEKTVLFQGRSVALNQLTSAESITESFPVANLLQEMELRIGKDPITSVINGYYEKCYIDRTFNLNIVIRQDITSDKRQNKFTDLLARNKQDFERLCQLNPNSNVHWLAEDKSGELVWQQSEGDLKILRKYIDVRKSQSYATSDLENLLQQAKKQKLMIISDKGGAGKSAVLTDLSKKIKYKCPAHWLVRVDLKDYMPQLNAQKGKKMDKESVLEFLSEQVLNLESNLEKELFKKSFLESEISKIVVMVDGFDEISPYYNNTVIDMLQILKQTSIEQLWVTTRPHLRNKLEDELQQLSYTLQPFSELEQVQFLEKFWTEYLHLELANQHRLKIYAKALIRSLAQSIGNKDIEFTGIPLQILTTAEAFQIEFFSFYRSKEPEPELPQKLNLLMLYRQFINTKYDIYCEEKCALNVNDVTVLEKRKRELKFINFDYQLLALKELFTGEEVPFLQNDHYSTFSDEELARLGIVHINKEGKPQFIDSTFAEYLVADFLTEQLTNKTKQHTQVQDFVLKLVLLRENLKATRSFLDELLKEIKLSKDTLKDFGEKIDKLWNGTEAHGSLSDVTIALRQAAAEDNAEIIGLFMESLKSAENSTTLQEIMLAIDNMKRPVWYMAGENRSLLALNAIWNWVEEVATKPRSSPLLSQDQYK